MQNLANGWQIGETAERLAKGAYRGFMGFLWEWQTGERKHVMVIAS
jgi:hypothetical protein